MYVSIWPHFQQLNFDRSRSIKVSCDGVIGLPIYDFLMVFNFNIWPNSAPLQDIDLHNLSDLDIDLSRTLKVKCDCVIGLPIYALILMVNNNNGLTQLFYGI